jgi:hypothetical protein
MLETPRNATTKPTSSSGAYPGVLDLSHETADATTPIAEKAARGSRSWVSKMLQKYAP